MNKLVKAETAEEAQELIERAAKENKVSEVRRIETMEVGKVVRQGDIYIHCVAATHEKGDPLDSRQLALGESLGSRHIAEEPAVCYEGYASPPWYEKPLTGVITSSFVPLLGPCIVSDKRFVITHPEHAHVDLPAGTYQITHQRDGRTSRQVID